MKKLNTRICILGNLLLFSAFTFAQSINPISLQRRLNHEGKNLPNFSQKFNPTVKTVANPPVPGLTDGVDIRLFPSSHVQAEVIIAINKAYPKNLLASANTLLGAFSYNQGFYASVNGGLTWTGSDQLQNINVNSVDGDPSVAFGADGTGFLTSIAAGGFSTSGYWFQKSSDGGRNWSAGVKGDNGANFDKEMIAADNIPTSPYANNFYCAWTDFNSGNGAVAFNRSTDKGTTFSSKIYLRSGAIGFGQGTNVQTGPNGEVYVCWADHTQVISPYKADGMGFARSTDGGITFTPASVIFPYRGTRVDGFDATYNFTRVNDFPSMAVDKSSKSHRGRIYIAYPEANVSDNHSEIKVRYSDNGGTSWSNPVIVNIPQARQSFFPWITVDDKYGIVWVVYYAFDQSTGYSTNTYVAASVNGTTWYSQKVSDVAHITAPIDNNNFAYGYAGDYIGIAAYNGVAYPTWMDNRNGTWQVYTSTVTAHASLMTPEAADNQSAATLHVSPNPFSNNLEIRLQGKDVKSVQLFYPSGTLAREWQGSHLETLNVAGLPKGIYTIKVLATDGSFYSQNILKQ